MAKTPPKKTIRSYAPPFQYKTNMNQTVANANALSLGGIMTPTVDRVLKLVGPQLGPVQKQTMRRKK